MTGLIGLILYTEFHKCHPVLDGESVKPEEVINIVDSDILYLTYCLHLFSFF